MTLTVREAYRKGWDAQARPGDWDDAADRFDRRYAPTYRDPAHRRLRAAWMDGWSDRQNGHRKWHALNCPLGLTIGPYHPGHENCEETS